MAVASVRERPADVWSRCCGWPSCRENEVRFPHKTTLILSMSKYSSWLQALRRVIRGIPRENRILADPGQLYLVAGLDKDARNKDEREPDEA